MDSLTSLKILSEMIKKSNDAAVDDIAGKASLAAMPVAMLSKGVAGAAAGGLLNTIDIASGTAKKFNSITKEKNLDRIKGFK